MLNASAPRIWRSTILLLMVLLASGCVTTEQGVVSDAQLSQGEGIVFGILNTNSHYSIGFKYGIYFSNDTDPNSVFIRGDTLRGDTNVPNLFFARRLPAGEYHASVLTTSNLNANLSDLDPRFTVTPNNATYIGSLQIEFVGTSTQGLFGKRPAWGVTIRVRNEFDKALQQYKA